LATTRVYILAKELGVKSAAIVKKCQDEGLDVKNHMSVLSAGLAATIREWFSEGDNITTIETAEKVDLKKVRIKKKKKEKPAEKETKVEKAKRAKPAAKRTKAAAETATATEAEQTEQEAATTTEAAATIGTAVTTAVTTIEELPPAEEQITEATPKEPEPIIPAGPMLEKPEPARLSGPQVVRVEAPEPVRRRPKPKPRVRYDAPVTEPLMYTQQKQEGPTLAPDLDKKQGTKRQKERTHGRRRDERDSEIVRKPKLSSRWRQRDIEERQARLDAAGGEGKLCLSGPKKP